MHFKGNGDSAIVQASLIWTMPTNIFKGGFTTPFLTGYWHNRKTACKLMQMGFKS